MLHAAVAAGAALLSVLLASADEPYKRMLDDPLSFTGTETLSPVEDAAEYRIGVFAPDGDENPVGRDLVRGVRLAVERANRAGGIDGTPLVIVRRWADDPWGAGSKEVIRMVFEDRVWALIGGPDGDTTHVAQQVATKAFLPLIAPVSSDPSLTHTRVPWIFRLPPNDRAQAETLVANGLAPRGLEAVGVLTSTNHDGRTFAAEFELAFERRRMTPLFRLAVGRAPDELESLAARVAGFSPHALVMRLDHAAVRPMLAALEKAGVDCPVFLPWIPGLELTEFPPVYDGAVIQVEPFETPMRCGAYLKLTRATIQEYAVRPSAATVYGYDAASLVIEALRRGAGGRVELRQRLAELSGFEGAGGVIGWDSGGGNTANAVLRTVAPHKGVRVLDDLDGGP